MAQKLVYFLIVVFFSNQAVADYLVSSEKYEFISGCRKEGFVFTRVLTFVCGEIDNEEKIFTNSSSVSCGDNTGMYMNRGGEVTFENCKFIEFNASYFKYLLPFEVFNASDVELDLLMSETFQNLTQLKRLILSHNNLVRIPHLLFADTNKLAKMDFSFNRLESIDPFAFEKAKNLEVLDLSCNVLTTIDERSFQNLASLKTLNISYNRLKDLDLHILPTSLKVLDLSVNEMKKIDSCNHLVNLKYLDLSFNLVSTLKVDTFANLLNLEHLKLRQMNLSNIQLGTFSHQHKLISLDLSENELKKINFKLFFPIFHDLKSLDLSDNYLTDLNGFQNELFPQLSLLDIKENQFNCSYLTDFMDAVNWEKLRLSIDINSANPLQPNIRGILCKHVDIEEDNIIEDNSNKYRIKLNISLQKLNKNMFIIEMSIIFICIATCLYFIASLLLHLDKIYEVVRICCCLKKQTSTLNYVEFSNEELMIK